MESIENIRLLRLHRSLLSDRQRTEGYRRAIFATVKKGDVALDLGTGMGILALFACQAGARKVYAIEARDVIEIAKRACLQNGYQDRVVFLKGLSYRLDLPEKVDVLITETMGNLGLEENILGTVMDARKRFLKRDGQPEEPL